SIQTTIDDIQGFKLIKIEGPFDGYGNAVEAAENGRAYYYCATLDEDPHSVDIKKVKWAASYDNGGKISLFRGGRIDTKNRVWVRLESSKAEKILKVYAYTGVIPHDDIKNFSCYITELGTGGFIYVIDPKKATPKESCEYNVKPTQKLLPIPWSDTDKRDLFSALKQGVRPKEVDYHLVEYSKDQEPPELYVCYAPVQWSAEYYKLMCSDSKLREERMQKVLCSGFSGGEQENEDLQCAYDGLSAAFAEDEGIGYRRLKRKVDQLAQAQEQKSGEDADLKPDMFVPLFDALSLASDMAEAIEEEITRHRANIEAIRFGKDPDEVAEHIRNNTKKTEFTEEDKKMNDMFSFALTAYQLVYNDKDSRNKYDGGSLGSHWQDLHYKEELEVSYCGDYVFTNIGPIGSGLYGPKLANVLGVEERKQQRALIRKLQDDFGKLLKNERFDKKLSDYDNKERYIGARVFYKKISINAKVPLSSSTRIGTKEEFLSKDFWY
ncbi:MAG: toxin VasX, partial [Bacteroidales bacterium]